MRGAVHSQTEIDGIFRFNVQRVQVKVRSGLIIDKSSIRSNQDGVDQSVLCIIVIPPVRIENAASVSKVTERVDEPGVCAVQINGDI